MLPYFDTIRAVLAEAEQKNADTIHDLAETIGKSIAAGGILHVFGTGHGHMLAEELFYRAGGLVPVNAILDSIVDAARERPLQFKCRTAFGLR